MQNLRLITTRIKWNSKIVNSVRRLCGGEIKDGIKLIRITYIYITIRF